MSLLACKGKGRPDNFQTPDWPLEKLACQIEQRSQETLIGKHILDPCCGKGNIVNFFINQGLRAFGTDILPEAGGIDFLRDEVAGIDVIITNPPYSLKDEFLTRCYELGKPFALLMPLTALEGVTRQSLYKQHGLELLLLPRRVNYETPSGKGSGAYFPSGWFTHGFGFGERMMFID